MTTFRKVRRFPGSLVRREGVLNPQHGAVLHCSECDETDSVLFSGSKPLPDDVIEKKFVQAGWEVGRDRDRDICPACVAKATIRKPKLPEPTVSKTAAPPPPASPPIAPFIAPSGLKRSINRRLSEVYDGESTGYVKGHSDITIAREMDCSPTLVAQIREEFHGSIASNPDMEEFAAKADALLELQAQIESRLTVALAEFQEIRTRLNELQPQIREIQSLLGKVQKVVA